MAHAAAKVPLGLVALAADPVTGTYVAGDTYWNTTLVCIRTYDGAVWTGGGSGGTQRTFATFIA